MHSRLRIANSHESAATEFFHELSYHTLNLIHIDGRLLVFAEHRAGRFVGLVDALRHDLHGIADLLHVLHHVAVGSFHFLHSAVNYPRYSVPAFLESSVMLVTLSCTCVSFSLVMRIISSVLVMDSVIFSEVSSR